MSQGQYAVVLQGKPTRLAGDFKFESSKYIARIRLVSSGLVAALSYLSSHDITPKRRKLLKPNTEQRVNKTKMPELDSAVLIALSLNPTVTTVASHGGSGFSSTFKISTETEDRRKDFFMKTGKDKDAETMFRGITPKISPQIPGHPGA